jgi:hypothetical protein
MNIYSTDTDSVEFVFFAVVPDSFMNRESVPGSHRSRKATGNDWADETDQPILAPHDPWSF